MGCPARGDVEPHVVGTRRDGVRACKHCYAPTQVFCGPHGSAEIEGFFRVICEGPVESDDTACPIGPSQPVATPQMARWDLEDHQERAQEDEGCLHQAKIVQI